LRRSTSIITNSLKDAADLGLCHGRRPRPC
jgi:hypothetical protein